MDAISIRGRRVRCLRHGMAGAPGLEVWGPYTEADEIREAILEAGRDLGLGQGGARAFSSNTLEVRWIPPPLPAGYTGEPMTKDRARHPRVGDQGTASLRGRLLVTNIAD